MFIPRLTPPFQINFEVERHPCGRPVDAARPLVRLGVLLWSYCFVIAPILIVTLGLLRVWLPVLIGLFTLAIIVIVCFARQRCDLRPQDPGGWKEGALPMILLPSPPSTPPTR